MGVTCAVSYGGFGWRQPLVAHAVQAYSLFGGPPFGVKGKHYVELEQRGASAPVEDRAIFQNNLPLAEKLERARIELLDLSARNRLLNMPRGARGSRSIKVIDEKTTDFERGEKNLTLQTIWRVTQALGGKAFIASQGTRSSLQGSASRRKHSQG